MQNEIEIMLGYINKELDKIGYRLIKLNAEISNSISPLELRIAIKRIGVTHRKLARDLNVTEGAITQAIDNDPLVKVLRIRLIQHLNSLQENKINSLKTTNNKEVA